MEDIPTDIKKIFIQFSDDKTRKHLRLANTSWFNLVQYDQFRVYFAKPHILPAITQRLSKYKWCIGLTMLKPIGITSRDIEEQIPKLTQLTSFECHMGLMRRDEDSQWMKLTTLTNLQHIHFVSGFLPMPPGVIYFYPNLTSISSCYAGNAATEIREVLFSKCANLEHLDLAALAPPDTNVPNIDHLHRLTYLSVHQSNMVPDLVKLTNLRYLNACYLRNGVNIGNITTLEALITDSRVEGDISANKNLMQLSLDLHTNPHQASALQSLQYLNTLWLNQYMDVNNNLGIIDNNQVLLSIPESLTYLRVDLANDFNMKNISHLTNLLNLKLVCSKNERLQVRLTPEDFKPFSRLTCLSLGEFFAAVKYLPELKSFEAWDFISINDGSTIDDFDPTHVTKLEKLSIWTHITSNVFNRLTALRSLKYLSLNEDLDEEYDYSVLLSMTALEDLRYNMKHKVTKDFWTVLQNLTNLQSLILEPNEVTSLEPKDVTSDMTLLTSLTRLTRLYIENVKLEHLLPFTFLQDIHTGRNTVVNITPQLLQENFPYLVNHNFQIRDTLETKAAPIPPIQNLPVAAGESNESENNFDLFSY